MQTHLVWILELIYQSHGTLEIHMSVIGCFWHGDNTKVIKLVVHRESILNIVGMTNSHWNFYKLLETKGFLQVALHVNCCQLPSIGKP